MQLSNQRTFYNSAKLQVILIRRDKQQQQQQNI